MVMVYKLNFYGILLLNLALIVNYKRKQRINVINPMYCVIVWVYEKLINLILKCLNSFLYNIG